MLGSLEDKLYAHQAIQDSVKVTDAEIKGVMEEKLDFIVGKIGSMDKVVEYYKKNSEEELKSYFDILKEQKLSSEKKIVEDVEITPEEVRNFLKVLQRRITSLLKWK
jgi:peptidyl-prolyl cis-trans isomerase SurA